MNQKRSRKSHQKSKKRRNKSQKAGTSYSGYSISNANGVPTTLDRLAMYWYETMGRHVWWSEGQPGYYFSNTTSYYMDTTHTHIYKIDDLDKKKDGMKRVYYSTKIDNERKEDRINIIMPYNDIVTWLTNKNEEIGAVYKPPPSR
jgi:hypothetical protein